MTGGVASHHGRDHPAWAGDTLTIVLAGVDPSVVGSQGRLHVSVAGIDMPVLQITAGLVPGTVQVMFQVTKSFNGYGVPMVVTVDSSHTDPFSIVVR